MIIQGQTYYQTDVTGNLTQLGLLHVSGSGLPSSQSPDKRYALLADSFPNPDDIWIMDLYTNERLFTFPPRAERADILFTNYFPDGFIVDSFTGARLFRYGEEGHTVLPDLGFGVYFTMLPDNTVLHHAFNEISHYNPATGEQTVIIEDISRIRDIHIELIIQRIFSS